MSLTSRFVRAEIVMDWIAVADIVLLIVCAIALTRASPTLPFAGARSTECAVTCAQPLPVVGKAR